MPVIYRGPGHDRHLYSALARGHDWAPAILSCPVILAPGVEALAPAAHAVRLLAAASALALPGLSADAAAAGQPDCSAGSVLNAGYHVALEFSPAVLPDFSAEQPRALFVLPAV